MTDQQYMPGDPVTGAAAAGNAISVATTPKTVAMLRQTKPWVRFMSILMFIGAAFTIIFSAVVGVTGIANGEAAFLLFMILYLLMALLFYIFPAVFLFRYANRIRDFMAQGLSENLDAALEAQKSFWKYVGILALVVLCIYAAILIVFIIALIMGVAVDGFG